MFGMDYDRDEVIAGMRVLADLLERNPDMPLPHNGSIGELHVHVMQSEPEQVKGSMRQIGRILRHATKRPVQKDTNDLFSQLQARLGGEQGLRVSVLARREQVCTRRVTGKRTVTRVQKDPAAVDALPDTTVEDVEDVVEWDCSPLLDDEEEVSSRG